MIFARLADVLFRIACGIIIISFVMVIKGISFVG